MADDVVVPGGLYPITFRNALAGADDAVTGDKTNLMNMALARGCWFQWEYSVQIDFQTDEVVDDLEELGDMRVLYDEVSNWTPLSLQNPATVSSQLNDLLRWGAGAALTDQASSATLTGVAGNFAWPPETSLQVFAGGPVFQIPSWREVQADPGMYPSGYIMKSTDGVYFRREGADVVQIEPGSIQLTFTGPIVASSDTIAQARRELEASIESKTQRNQEKQVRLQDLAAALQRWITFTTNLNERKKRDADTLAGNFH